MDGAHTARNRRTTTRKSHLPLAHDGKEVGDAAVAAEHLIRMHSVLRHALCDAVRVSTSVTHTAHPTDSAQCYDAVQLLF